MTIGERIKAAREAKGWTQAELAAKMDYHVDTISNLERGVYKPTSRAMMMFERVLKIRLVK